MSDFIAKAAQYWKFIIAALTPVFLAVQAAVTDSSISVEEWAAIGVAVAIAIGVLLKGNAEPPAAPLPAPQPPKG